MPMLSQVRKHRAPKSALRQADLAVQLDLVGSVRKYRAPKGALRLIKGGDVTLIVSCRQKAPSTIRCIKTSDAGASCPESAHPVRKHRAPKGALRRWNPPNSGVRRQVRKHRAPKGALRPLVVDLNVDRGINGERQKAPSAKRCIKTLRRRAWLRRGSPIRKHRAPKGALRLRDLEVPVERVALSESTERQKVH